MDLEELQAALDKLVDTNTEWDPIVDAARLVANPNITIWICRVLHLAFIRGDETDGARIGLPAFCAKELHQDCGWLAALTPQGDTDGRTN